MYKSGLLSVVFLFALAFNTCFANTEHGGEQEPLPLDELRTFTEVFAKIKSDYVEPISDRQLLENAIRGMLEGLDPHSAYLDREGYRRLQEGTTGEFGGLGIEVSMENGFVKVISPIDDTPASRAGIKAGDIIIRIGDKAVRGMTLNEAVQLMRGKPGSEIMLTIARESEEKPFDVKIVRDIITVKSVKGRMLEPGYAYVRISNFQSHTAEDLRKKIEGLRSGNKEHLHGLILDLRNNPGGILNAAVAVADLFLDSGLIVYTEGRVKDSRLKFTASPADILQNAPIIVLVNGGSASASEIVAGALQDHQRGIIIGEQTFGKGSVQTILPMNNKAALKLTTARYYTPTGRSIQADGIKPDIIIEPVRFDKIDTNQLIIKEANLSGSLANERVKDNNAKQQPDQREGPTLVETDYQLYEALNILKGLVINLRRAG